jgi:AT-binding transcription factor 1
MDSMLKQALQEAHMRNMIMGMNNNKGDRIGEGSSSASSSCHSSPIHACPFCHYTTSSETKIQQHVFNQHSHKSTPSTPVKVKKVIEYLCPLCQEAFPENATIEPHLVEVHNVNAGRLQKLMQLVEQKEVTSPNKHDNDMDDMPTTAAGEFEAHLLEQQANKFLRLGGGVDLSSLPNISDRHVYKYRCHQCSQAFKTAEKLQLHSQYHLIRAATQCVLCSRSFRSLEALQRHIESSHQDMTDGEAETYRQSLLNNPFLSGRQGGILDPQTTELLRRESNRIDQSDQADDEAEGDDGMDTDEHDHGRNSLEDHLNSQEMAENNYNDPDRKYRCHRCKVAFTRQSYLTSHNKTLLHRKGEKMSYPMEKYLDPNRPFKCDICKESFTQKNILLVHYNSVSHLHKLKQDQQRRKRDPLRKRRRERTLLLLQ